VYQDGRPSEVVEKLVAEPPALPSPRDQPRHVYELHWGEADAVDDDVASGVAVDVSAGASVNSHVPNAHVGVYGGEGGWGDLHVF